MNRLTYIFALLATVLISTNAFAPSTPLTTVSSRTTSAVTSKTTVNMAFGGGEDDNFTPLTRENEPDEYFSSKMDEMSDAEKLPIALGGLAFVSLPFLAGLVALYASK
jgi:hypothetical protein